MTHFELPSPLYKDDLEAVPGSIGPICSEVVIGNIRWFIKLRWIAVGVFLGIDTAFLIMTPFFLLLNPYSDR